MIHLKATLTFDKLKDGKELESFQDILFSYNLLCSMSEMEVLQTEQVDCGDTIEFRVDSDLNFTNWGKLVENTEMMSKFMSKNINEFN